jgi:hypothetical protein
LLAADPAGKLNYPANFQVERGIDLFIEGEYLYWGAEEDGLYFATSHDQLQALDPAFTNGLRMGAGVSFPKAGYEIALQWLWYKTEAHNSAHGSLTPLWAESGAFTPVSFASGHWHLNMNVIDLEWGRASWMGGHFSLRPFFSVRAALLNQHLDNHYSTGSVHAHSNFNGGGLRAGAEGHFILPCDFALYGLFSGSLLYGQFNAQAKTQGSRTHDTFYGAPASLQMALGTSWDHHLANDRFHIEFHVGWEQNTWFGVNKMNHYLHTLSNGLFFQEKGNLSTQGVVAGGRFDF